MLVHSWVSAKRDGASYSGCYYNREKYTESVSLEGVHGLTTEQFANKDNFVNWDFQNTWIMKDGHPELRIFVK